MQLEEPYRGERPTNVVIGAIWMVVITLALFFLPAINGLIGGFVGGYLVGSPIRGFWAAIIPAIAAAIGLWILLALLHLPIVGFLAGATVGAFIVIADVGMLIGAVVGGAFSQWRRLNSTPTTGAGV